VCYRPHSYAKGKRMRAEERALAAERLRQIADEVGLEVSDERLERLVGLLESTVDGVRAAGSELDDCEPAFVADLGEDQP
jgi:hypothetical protein